MEPEIDIYGTKRWFLDDKLHREDGPAVIRDGGAQIWYQNDECHRVGGPAVIGDNGYQAWYLNGKFHRVDGPAVIYPNGSVQYWAFDTQYKSLEELTIGIVVNQ